ncbi:MFS transporter [Nocardioides sp. B-3]|uniref:MFS transporter n=1 Tax=Nocardioides sp. B-3 TaxID=2895565 RepID=UPI002152097F|nr:MFS transporter [Nocardioides sp. B-3]UUZ58227.1 MFS transporter [Nocardioides sp. B-3]
MKETRGHARAEAQAHAEVDERTDGQVFAATSFREPALSAASRAGPVNNLNDGSAWGLFAVLFASAGLGLGQSGIPVAVYPAVWGLGQLVTGALSDRWGRKHLITVGMMVRAASPAAVAVADSFTRWLVAGIGLGLGTAMVYPTLLAVVGDVAHPSRRARAVGVYRLWRDLGFAVGALLTGVPADLWGIRGAIWFVAALTAASGLVVAVRMYETHPPARR